MIVYEHTFPVSAIVTALATALILGLLSAWKFLPRRWLNGVIFLLYTLVLLGMGWCLLLPGLKNALTQLRKPRFFIALDTSQSMTLTPSPDVPSRWATARPMSWVGSTRRWAATRCAARRSSPGTH